MIRGDGRAARVPYFTPFKLSLSNHTFRAIPEFEHRHGSVSTKDSTPTCLLNDGADLLLITSISIAVI